MNCWRHHGTVAVGVCAACGKGLCATACARDGAQGLHCDATCAKRLRARAHADAPATVAWAWSSLLLVLGAALLWFGYRHSEFSMSVPNLLGLLFLWYGAVLLLQRVAQRRTGAARDASAQDDATAAAPAADAGTTASPASRARGDDAPRS